MISSEHTTYDDRNNHDNRSNTSNMIKNLSDLGYVSIYHITNKRYTLHPFVDAIKNNDLTKMKDLMSTLDQQTLYDGIIFACHFGNSNAALFLIDNGVNCKLKNDKKMFELTMNEKLKLMGHVVHYMSRNIIKTNDIIEKLLRIGIDIDDVSNDKSEYLSALDVYYNFHRYTPNIETLKTILGNKRIKRIKRIKKINSSMDLSDTSLFTIGTLASFDELKLLLEHKLDPNSILRKEKNTHLKIKNGGNNNNNNNNNPCAYHREVNLLDILMIDANNKNMYRKDNESIRKVLLLLDYGANYSNTNNYCDWNYLHISTVPDIVEALCRTGLSIKHMAQFQKFTKEYVSPADLVVDPVIHEIFLKYEQKQISTSSRHVDIHNGTNIDIHNSTDTDTHNSTDIDIHDTIDIHISSSNNDSSSGSRGSSGSDSSDIYPEVDFVKLTTDNMKYISLYGIKNLIKNLTKYKKYENEDEDKDGYDCTRICSESGQTILHCLFESFSDNSISVIDDFVHLAESDELRMINILIKCGAQPLKDNIGRTPLMCMSFNPTNNLVNNVIEMYCEFEASHYGLDKNKYLENILSLRIGKFNTDTKNVEKFKFYCPSKLAAKDVFDKFWQNFHK
jgi:hypothetical protein